MSILHERTMLVLAAVVLQAAISLAVVQQGPSEGHDDVRFIRSALVDPAAAIRLLASDAMLHRGERRQTEAVEALPPFATFLVALSSRYEPS